MELVTTQDLEVSLIISSSLHFQPIQKKTFPAIQGPTGVCFGIAIASQKVCCYKASIHVHLAGHLLEFRGNITVYLPLDHIQHGMAADKMVMFQHANWSLG